MLSKGQVLLALRSQSLGTTRQGEREQTLDFQWFPGWRSEGRSTVSGKSVQALDANRHNMTQPHEPLRVLYTLQALQPLGTWCIISPTRSSGHPKSTCKISNERIIRRTLQDSTACLRKKEPKHCDFQYVAEDSRNHLLKTLLGVHVGFHGFIDVTLSCLHWPILARWCSACLTEHQTHAVQPQAGPRQGRSQGKKRHDNLWQVLSGNQTWQWEAPFK